jgi:hypothetical protein
VIGFNQIKWPDNLMPRLSLTEADVTESTQQTELTKSPERTEPTDGTQANICGKGLAVSASGFSTFDDALAAARTTGPHANHSRLFTLARGAKAVELARNQTITDAELRNLFDRWYEESKPHLRRELGPDDYWFEFQEAFENVRHPLGTGVVEAAWIAAVKAQPPAEAEQFRDVNLRHVVCLCREMWISTGRKPFFLSCRTLQRLLGHSDHVRAARWLRGLCRSKILQVIEVGGPKGRRATRYRYLPPIE